MKKNKTMSSRQIEVAEQLDNKATLSNWRDWRWQLKNAITDIDTFETLTGIEFSDEIRPDLLKTLNKFPLSVTPYYLSLIDPENWETDPVFMQSFPSPKELDVSHFDMEDPLAEDKDRVTPCLTHRYPDRVLFLVNGVCSMYCRHCTRKRRVGDRDAIPNTAELEEAIDYIRRTSQVRDVLLSGGDPLLLSNKRLDWLLGELRSIDHVEIIRIGSRLPVVLPYRITDDLVQVLRRHHPLWVNTHFNHPRELTASARTALATLADAGIPLGNQSVLLAGVNDCPRIMKALVHKLVMNRVRPYYLYQCDLAEGLSHFRTPVGKGIEILESLIGHTTGFSVPTYVIDAPGGGGKIRVNPNYLISWSTNKVILRNYEGVITSYKEPDSYEPGFCDRKCEKCDLLLNLDDASEVAAVGIEKLLADYDDSIALTPAENERLERREQQ